MIAENAVILIEQIEGARRAGREVREAVIEAWPRFRPIMLAASSTVVALIPIAPMVSGRTMAFAIMGGLRVASLPTRLVLSAAYVKWFGRRWASPSPKFRVARAVPAQVGP